MSDTITVELPEELLLQALRQLSAERRQWLFNQIMLDPVPLPHGTPARDLDKWTGLIAVGGDSLAESEQLYDD